MGDNNPEPSSGPSQAFVSGSIVVRGEGAAPSGAYSAAQKRLMALRAARVVALREAASMVGGVTVDGETTIVNAASKSDVVRTMVQGVIKGARTVKEDYGPSTGMAIVYLSVPMTGPGGLIGTLLPQVTPMYPGGMPPFVPGPGVASTGTYDGLIIDVRGHPFKPALINRVLTGGGEVVYDPSSVAGDVLVERGAAGYTNDIGKARALLAERGSTNPLVVRAGGVLRSTDVRIAPGDAEVVLTSNRSNNFLERARVVFVLR
ncbi:MAG: hypothetical protein ACE5GY_00225 [Thermodesulfobacteriota bacterium]